MSEEETSYLRKEIDRQNQIITVLLEQNAFLKKENAHLRTGIRRQQPTDSYEETEIGSPQIEDSHAETWLGSHQATDSNYETELGNQHTVNSQPKTDVGFQQTIASHAETVIGSQQTTDSQHKTDIGNNPAAKPLPETWAIDESAVRRVSRRLKEHGFKNVKQAGKRNIAKVLLHFYNKGKGGFKELHKVTGLSEGGVGKLMMSLQKRGTVHRTAYQQYALSAGAMQILRMAYQDVDRGGFTFH